MSRHYTTKVTNISLTKLRKLEVHSLYTEVIDIIKRHDTKAINIDTVCTVLMGMQEKAELLYTTDWEFTPHPLTEKLAELREKRYKFAALITNHMRTVEKAGFKGTEPFIKLAKPEVERYLINLRQNNQRVTTQLVMQFFDELDENPQLKEAFHELGFKPYLNELKATQDAFLKTYGKRRLQLSKRHKGSTQPIQRELIHLINILFKQVDYYQHAYKDIDYSHIISSLNYMIASYNKLIKTRDTKRSNRKIKEIEDEQAALEEQLKMERIAQKQAGVDSDSSAIEATAEAKKRLEEKLSIAKKKRKDKEKPIGGLLDILKKPDEGEKNEDNEKDEKDPE